MFWTVFPPIIGSLRLYIQHQVYVRFYLLLACRDEMEDSISFLLASSQQNLFDIYLMEFQLVPTSKQSAESV